MKVLHTADWHLGKRLGTHERNDEHAAFLNWLLETIQLEEADVLIIAGDVFDTGNPSNFALKLYYDFLLSIQSTNCKTVVIVGGNHDSASMLEAPKDLLLHLNIHIVGATSDVGKEIIPIYNSEGEVSLIICAVPFLRDKDIKLSISGETIKERQDRIAQAIEDHYNKFIPYFTKYKEKGIPVIATGHLFAAGGRTSPESEKEIHVGNLGQVSGSRFSLDFDYIALGHLHRKQIVNKAEHIRYSGSPLPLSFSEHDDPKVIVSIEFNKNEPIRINEIDIPKYRRLIRIKGDVFEVKQKLIDLEKEDIPTWLEIRVDVQTHNVIPNLEQELNNLIRDKGKIEIIFIKQICIQVIEDLGSQSTIESLQELDPLKIFEMKCLLNNSLVDEELMFTFKEALELMREEEIDFKN